MFCVVSLCLLSHFCLNSSQLSHQSEHRCGCESCCGNFQLGDRSNSLFFCLRREQQRKPGTPECAGVFPVGWVRSDPSNFFKIKNGKAARGLFLCVAVKTWTCGAVSLELHGLPFCSRNLQLHVTQEKTKITVVWDFYGMVGRKQYTPDSHQ